ncbi:hypothetical protein NVP1081O_020 [Vibrio phage 1.081.O._10N.286.52.C2]|nr:hypothetical protein NVP1081O_020 [Vibrio phage 1.081.O._10N.286.52.C2]
MIAEYLKKLTKREITEFALEYYDIELSATTKGRMISEISEFQEAPVKPLPAELTETVVVELDAIVELENSPDEIKREVIEMAQTLSEVVEIKDDFKPLWMPTYRRGDECYHPLPESVLIEWHLGRRDTDVLKTIEFWVKRNGKLLIHNSTKNMFVTLG